MLRIWHAVFALTLVCGPLGTWFPDAASAQVSSSRRQAAESSLEQGLILAAEGRWSTALAAFRRSADLAPSAEASYNIANALHHLGRPADGLDELDRYDTLDEVRRDYEAWSRGAALRRLMEAAVSELRLRITPREAVLFINDQQSETSGFERAIRLNPGTYAIRVAHEGHRTWTKEVELKPGDLDGYTIVLEEAPAAAAAMTITPSGVTPSQPPKDEKKPLVKRPGFWVMISAIVVVGVGTGVAIALTRKDDSPPCGTTGECATTSGLTVASF